jgi:hypothetical protein
VCQAKCPPQPTLLAAVTWGRQTAQISCHLGSDVTESYSYSASGRKDPQQYRHLHRSGCTNTLIYAHTTSRTVPTCDMSLGWLTVAVPEAGDFVELLETYLYLENLSFSRSRCGTVTCNFRNSIDGKLMTLPFFNQNIYYKHWWILHTDCTLVRFWSKSIYTLLPSAQSKTVLTCNWLLPSILCRSQREKLYAHPNVYFHDVYWGRFAFPSYCKVCCIPYVNRHFLYKTF